MKRKLRDKWVAALRSGKYPQGHGRLSRKTADGTSKFCCLGVLCEVLVDEGLLEREYVKYGECYYTRHQKPVTTHAYLGKSVVTLVGEQFNQYILTHMNDWKKSSFADIANWIEANVPVDNG